jgi:hypothetical protein
MPAAGPPARAIRRPSAAPAGVFLLADLSGFTAHLAGVELDHAHGALRDLLEAVIACLLPPFSVAGLEGDGVFAYAPAAGLYDRFVFSRPLHRPHPHHQRLAPACRASAPPSIVRLPLGPRAPRWAIITTRMSGTKNRLPGLTT